MKSNMAEIKLIWNNLAPFDEVNINAIGKVAGVYRLSYTNDEGKNFYVFYVSKSDDLKKDLLAIFNYETQNICLTQHLKSFTCKFRFAVIEEPIIREAAERQVYKFYQPSCNEPIKMVNEDITINVT